MNNIQELIVILWLVPVVGLIVLPFLWSILGMLYRAVERSRLHDIQGYVAMNDRDASSGKSAEHRERPRIHLAEGQACIDEECDCCKAMVSDISNHGICLKNVPKRMYLEDNPFRVVFRTKEKDYTVTAKPVWKKLTGGGYVIGAEIDRIPRGWKELVTGLSQSLVPKPA